VKYEIFYKFDSVYNGDKTFPNRWRFDRVIGQI